MRVVLGHGVRFVPSGPGRVPGVYCVAWVPTVVGAMGPP
ncbi:hypothetical protein FM106_02655 [Brachybacterium faecium]|nr:hypothetical protein FM106_02655 [Brachybacterium faecium]